MSITFTYDEVKKMISREEGYDVEFKESLVGLKPEDLVAFANSHHGGNILIGIKDSKADDGRQYGTIVGSVISDEGKLSILNRAQSCRPPINLEIYPFSIEEKSIYIIRIPSGQFKPYCTDGGTYRTRGDGQKKSLYPTELLSLFMESEKNKFISNFKEATESLEKGLSETRKQLVGETNKILATFKSFETNIESSLSSISSSAENAESTSDSVESTVSNIEDSVDDIWTLLFSSQYLLPMIHSKLMSDENEKTTEGYINELFSRYLDKVNISNFNPHTRAFKRQILVLSKLFPNINKTIIEKQCMQIVKQRRINK